MYLFDTDIITNIFKKQPAPGLLARLAGIPRSQQHISSVTVSEIVYGACKSGRPSHHLRNLQEVLLPAVNLLGFDSKAALVCGRIRAELEKAGTPLDLADLEIAAIALANQLVLVTGNIRHFARIPGLAVENWLV
ncbi:MAG: type II toxin-antitoxin system VapC family toxin [Betaproteobacteria bacterium]|nr:type II toxin-antitoxin system VapC family toxin [Betaproteobacteria bacterium]